MKSNSFFLRISILFFFTTIFSVNAQSQTKEAFTWLTQTKYEKCRYYKCDETLVCRTMDYAEAYFLKTDRKQKIEINIIQKCVAGTDLYIFYKGRKQGILNSDFEVIVPPVYSTLMAAKEPGYFNARNSQVDSSFLINANVQPVEILDFAGAILNKGKGFVTVGSFESEKTKVYDLKGNLLFDNEEYRLTPIDENSNFIEGNHRESEEQVLFKLDGSIFYRTPDNCFGIMKDLGEVIKVECYKGNYFVDKKVKVIEGEIKIPDDKFPFKRVHNCDSKNRRSVGVYFDETEKQTQCEFTSISSIEYDEILTAFDENYKMTLFDFAGNVIYKGRKSEVVFPLGHDLFQVIEKATYPVIGGKKYGVKNGKGKTIVPFKYTVDSDFSRPCKTFKIDGQIYLLILDGNEILIYNEKGKLQTKKSFSNVSNDMRTYFKQVGNLILIKVNGKPSLMDVKGNLKLAAADIKIINKNSPICIIQEKGKYHLWDLEIDEAVLEDYDELVVLGNRIIIVKKKGKIGALRLN